MYSKYCLLTLLLFCCFSSLAQKETALWHFGPKLTFDFSSGAAKFVAGNTSLNTLEGSASICDREGRLLFYTDGVTVWSADHKAMPHGDSLKGHRSSTHSAIILPRPGDNNTYYIITADEEGYFSPPNDGVHYSMVNMCLNNGLGDVVEASKNTSLFVPATEKLAAVRHSNGEDIWIVAHKWNSNEFYTYLLTHEGINSIPVVSPVGKSHEGYIDNHIGQMKLSPDGKKLALTVLTDSFYELFDFDASTGKVSNPVEVKPTGFNGITYSSNTAYGLEFSPDGSKLYLTTNRMNIDQYDVSLPTAEQICNSVKRVRSLGEYPGYHARVKGMQMGLDGKIYVVRQHEDSQAIGVINQPNLTGIACDYKDRQIITNNLSTSYTSFPTFMASYFSTADKIDYHSTCLGDSMRLWIKTSANIHSVEWQFGEQGSKKYTSINKQAAHLYAQAGSYVVQAALTYKDGSTKLLTRKVNLQPSLSVNLGKDTLLCAGQTLQLDVSSLQGYHPVWQDGSTAATYTVSLPGTYWVEICKGACSSRDSIVVSYLDAPTVDLGADLFICDGKPVKLVATTSYGAYQWSNGSTEEEVTITKTGTYYVTVTTPCGGAGDTINVTFEDTPTVDLGEDLTLCVGDTLLLNAYSPQANRYRWRNLESDPAYSTHPTLAITEEGSYEVELGSATCLVRDTIYVTFLECEDKLFIPNVITPNGDGRNDHFLIGGILKGQWHLDIYNRNGKVVYSSTAYQNDWDGSALSGNTFYYYLYNSEKKRKYKGWIQVLR